MYHILFKPLLSDENVILFFNILGAKKKSMLISLIRLQMGMVYIGLASELYRDTHVYK